MNGYYLFWAILIVASLWVSLGGFFWAYRHGQFKDQDRARFLPLRGEAEPLLPAKVRGGGHEAFVMMGILAVGISAILVVLIMAIVRTAGGRL
jgi:nitrogen fixation-related uncharacterized protein